MATQQALQEQLNKLVDQYGPLQIDPAHCRDCREFTHGSICVYCFPKEAVEESRIRAALREGA